MTGMGIQEKLVEKTWRPEDTYQTKIPHYMKKRKREWNKKASKEYTQLPPEDRESLSPPRKRQRLVLEDASDTLTTITALPTLEVLTEDLQRLTLQHNYTELIWKFQAAKQTEITKYLQPKSNASHTTMSSFQMNNEDIFQVNNKDTTDQISDDKENQQREINWKGDCGKKRPSIKTSDMKTLHKLSALVCQVHFNGIPCGTGFLLFDRVILTNAHVVMNFLDGQTGQLLPSVTVTFDKRTEKAPVDKLIAFRHYSSSHCVLDYALLRLAESQRIPSLPGLLSKSSKLQHCSQIYIIGHPDGGEKEMSLAVIIEFEKRAMAFDKHFTENPGHIGAIVGALLKEKWDFKEMDNPQLITYLTNFFHGSSGSPVLLSDGQLVAMHTGGYSYEVDGKTHSIIEYAIPIGSILKDSMWELLNSKGMPEQQKLEHLGLLVKESLKGSNDMLEMIAFFITEVLMRLSENQLHLQALRLLLDVVKRTGKRTRMQFCKALRKAMDTTPPLKGMSKQGLVSQAKSEEERSTLDALGKLLFPENQRGALMDVSVNAHSRKRRGKNGGRGGRWNMSVSRGPCRV